MSPPLPRFDRNLLVIDTALSITSAVVSSALGASWLGSLILAALAPALLTYVHHPGPGRRRRIAIGLALYALLHLLQSWLARLRGRAPRPRVRGWGHTLRFAEVTAGVAFAITVVTLTAPELVLGDSLVTNRSLTLFPGQAAKTCPAPRQTEPETEPAEKEKRIRKRHGGGPTATATPTPSPTPGKPATPPITPEGDKPDRTAPALHLPADITVRAGTMVRYHATASDKIDGPVPVSCRPASGSRFPVGTATVRCTARDRAGNDATGSFTVRVLAPPEPTRTPTATPTPTPTPPPDTTPPVFAQVGTIFVDTNEPEDTPVAYPFPTATDDRDPVVDVTCVPATIPAGTRDEVSCTAVDDAGNEAHVSPMVYVRISS